MSRSSGVAEHVCSLCEDNHLHHALPAVAAAEPAAAEPAAADAAAAVTAATVAAAAVTAAAVTAASITSATPRSYSSGFGGGVQ